MKPSLPQGNNEQTLPGKLNGSRGAEESAKPKFFPQPGYVLHYITKAAQTPTQTQTPYRKHTPEQQKDGTCTAHFSCRNYCTGDRAGGQGAGKGAKRRLRTDAAARVWHCMSVSSTSRQTQAFPGLQPQVLPCKIKNT